MATLYSAQPPPQVSYPGPFAQPTTYAPPQNPQRHHQPLQASVQQQQPPFQPSAANIDPYAPPTDFYPSQQAYPPPPPPHSSGLAPSDAYARTSFDGGRRRSSSSPRRASGAFDLQSFNFTPINDPSGRRFSAEYPRGGDSGRRASPSSHRSSKSRHSGHHSRRASHEYDRPDESQIKERRPTLGDTLFGIWDKIKGR